jgi:small-conductance mechanosensitive channel
MKLLVDGIAVAGMAVGVALVVVAAPAQAACLPGQTCWQPPQLQSSPLPPRRDDSAEQQFNQDRATLNQQRQDLIQDRANLRTPPGTQTPLDRIQQREQLRQDHDQVLQMQRNLQQSQQHMLDQNRPPAPTPYYPKP